MINILTEQNVRAQLATLRAARRADLARPRRRCRRSTSTQAREFIALRRGGGARRGRRSSPRSRCRRAAYAAYKAALPRLADTPPPSDRLRPRRGHRSTRIPQVLAGAARRSRSASRSTSTALDDGIARLYGTRRLRAHRLPAGRGRRPARARRRRRREVVGPNYLRFGARCSTDFQGETAFALLAGPPARLGQQPGRASG